MSTQSTVGSSEPTGRGDRKLSRPLADAEDLDPIEDSRHRRSAGEILRQYGPTIVAAALAGLALYGAYRLVMRRGGTGVGAAPRHQQACVSINNDSNAFVRNGGETGGDDRRSTASQGLLQFAARCVDKKNLKNETWMSGKMGSSSLECGEDSFFVSGAAFGVADGVGGWARHGISAKAFSQGLADNGLDEAREAERQQAVRSGVDHPIHPAALLHAADVKTKKAVDAGSSTACFATVDPRDQLLRVVNVGDSGVLVVRDKNVVFQAEETNHGFNFPKQLGSYPKSSSGKSDKASDGWIGSFKLEPNDVIVAATDGVFDNVRTSDVANIVYHTVGAGKQGPPDLEMAAVDIVTRACKNATGSGGAWGMTPTGVGGKPDDITVLVLKVRNNNETGEKE